MSRHSGVTCDSCMKSGFSGPRYKCLVCCDYDLCSTCYEAGLATARHKPDHAMQRLLTRADFDIFFGGEELSSLLHQSFTCPYCHRLGMTAIGLQDHVDQEHAEDTLEVVCPVCAATPGADANYMTDDLLSHLSVDHSTHKTNVYDGEGDGASQSAVHRSAIDRQMHNGGGASRPQLRRADAMRHHVVPTGDVSSAAGNTRRRRDFENVDPVSELLSQLTSGAPSRTAAMRNVSAQLHQLELQLQSTRQQLEGLPLRATAGLPSGTSALRTVTSGGHKLIILSNPSSAGGAASTSVAPTGGDEANYLSADGRTARGGAEAQRYLLSSLLGNELSELETETIEHISADRSIFVQELLLFATATAGSIVLDDDVDENSLTSSPPDLTFKPCSLPPTPADPPASLTFPRTGAVSVLDADTSDKEGIGVSSRCTNNVGFPSAAATGIHKDRSGNNRESSS